MPENMCVGLCVRVYVCRGAWIFMCERAAVFQE